MWIVYFKCDTPAEGVTVKNEEDAKDFCAWDSNLTYAKIERKG